MFKKVMVLMCSLVILVGGVLSNSFSSNASEMDKGLEFNLNYAEPSTSDNQGYITLLTRDSAGVYGIFTYFWNTIASANGSLSPTYAYLTIESTSFTFNIGGTSGSTGAYYSLTQIDNVGYWWNIKNSSSESCTVDLASHDRTILGWHYKGNVGYCNGFNTTPFTVYFNSDASSILLRDVWDLIHSTYYQNEEMISELETLYSLQSNRLSQVVSWLETINGNTTLIDSKLSTLIQRGNEIIAEQKKTNTWLEKIFNFLEEKDEKEKEVATQQGSSSTSQGMDAIEDKGGDFASSLGGLTNSMSYSGTQCAWDFPEVKLPAIPGVMNEFVLIQRQPIDFEQWVNAIPSDILLVVQSVCTIGLIVYCFKELYNTIAYVLTLRRDDNE